MSFLKSLFGLGGKEAGDGAPATVAQVEHKGFTIRATPFKEAGQYQTCGVISKEVGGVLKEHKFIRADRFPALETAAEIAISKGKQIVDEQGERIFT
ncbi:MAG: hypothetical protein JNM20_09885 [Rhizobiales bacterium]|nr:hypothetical protein [Hyphomicrobiales bacterium]